MNKLLIATCIILLTGCSSGQKKEAAEAARKEFIMVDVPLTITEPEQRANYLATHYWDTFDFGDTSYISLPDVTEQALSNYIDVLNYVSPQTASVSIKKMLAKAEADSAMLAHFCSIYDKYLYDPNSPLRNEEFYIPVLEFILASDKVDDVEKIRPQHQLDLALKNKVGQQAANFEYTLPSGAISNLYDIKSDYIILFFYNPDCDTCKEVRKEISASEVITDMEQKKLVKIVAIYPDEDIAAWKKYQPEIPKNWINGYDKVLMIREKETYDLKAIPTLYLLDKDKKVLLKDVSFPVLEKYLFNRVK